MAKITICFLKVCFKRLVFTKMPTSKILHMSKFDKHSTCGFSNFVKFSHNKSKDKLFFNPGPVCIKLLKKYWKLLKKYFIEIINIKHKK